jgi:type I restriction enzyme S subunit
MKGWKEVKIGDLGKVITGNTPPKKDPSNYGGKYPFIKPTDMDLGRRYVTHWDENYSEKAFKRYKNSYIPPKATGVVTIGTVGEKMFQADQYCFTNQSVNVVIPNDEYDEDFIYYLLKISLPKVENANPGTASGRHHVSKSNFCAIKAKVPETKETQRKIASILSAYDNLIENNLKRIQLLEEQAQQTYEDWFVRLKFPGYEAAVFNEETGLPVGWEKMLLGDVLEISSSKRIFLSDYVSEGIPFYRGKEIILKSKNEALTDRLYISTEKFKEIKAKYDVPTEGDILVTAVGTLGYPYLVTKSDGDFYFKDGNLIWLKGNNKISSTYLISSFKNEHFQTMLNNIAIGSSQKALTIKSLKAIKHTIPNLSIQEKYDDLVILIYNAIENLQNQNQLLKEARDLLLPRLMSGMIDLDSLEVEESMGIVAE